jgi:hypothetical protein
MNMSVLVAVLHREVGIEPERLLGVGEDLLAVGLGDAHHVGDHVQRQPEGEVVHEVGRVAAPQAVDDGVGAGAELVLQGGDPPGREALVHDLAHLDVLVAVEVDEQVHLRLGRRAGRDLHERSR